VLPPEGIDLLQDEEALRYAYLSRASVFHLALLDVVVIAHMLLQERHKLIKGEALQLRRLEILQQIHELPGLAHHLLKVPLFGGQIEAYMSIYGVDYRALTIAHHLLLEASTFKNTTALRVDIYKLLFHHLIEFNHLRSNIAIVCLYRRGLSFTAMTIHKKPVSAALSAN